MKWLLLRAIRIYQSVPFKRDRVCIFRESCSHHVYRVTSESGFLAGIRAFAERGQQCRPGYRISLDPDGNPVATLADGSVLDADLLSPAAFQMSLGRGNAVLFPGVDD
jgi:putative component of membrane protein insertase Oxa1/YidC/SpoIIIJ protein YidD